MAAASREDFGIFSLNEIRHTTPRGRKSVLGEGREDEERDEGTGRGNGKHMEKERNGKRSEERKMMGRMELRKNKWKKREKWEEK